MVYLSKYTLFALISQKMINTVQMMVILAVVQVGGSR